MNFFKGLFTRHLFAKFFALAFAVVTIYLVHRELTVPWYNQDMPVILAKDAAAISDRGEPFVVLSSDPNVWVRNDLEKIRLTIKGPAKDLAEFKRNPRIDLRIRSSWADTKAEVRQHLLLDDDFRISLQGAEIDVAAETTVGVDLVKEYPNVELKLKPPETLADNREYLAEKTIIRPDFVTVRGPRHELEGILGANKQDRSLQIELEPIRSGNVYAVDKTYAAKLAESWRKKGVEIVDQSDIEVVLGAKSEDLDVLRLENRVVHWFLRERDIEAIAVGDISVENSLAMECTVILEGPKSVIAAYSSDGALRASLATLNVFADPTTAIDEAIVPGEVKGPDLSIQVSGVPARLRLRGTDPPRIPARITRIEKEDN